jgi:flavodoxin
MKIIAVGAAALFLFLGCAGRLAQNQSVEAQAEAPTEAQSEAQPVPGGERVLVAYFSRTGNTETLAATIHELAGGDLFEITPSAPYPENYNDCLARATQELADDSRPPLSTRVENMAGYELIFIGYPIWLGNTPMVIRSFLEEYDLAGKTIIPFCTNGGSGLANSVAAIRSLCPGSSVREGLAITGSRAGTARNTVSDWLKGLGI